MKSKSKLTYSIDAQAVIKIKKSDDIPNTYH